MQLHSTSAGVRDVRLGALQPSRISTKRPIVHVVEQLAPGGIETLVVDLVHDGTDRIISLSGTVDALVEGWPALEPLRDRLEAFDRPKGVSPSLILKLTQRLVALAPIAVVVHHIGPLIYGGAAARLARVPCIIYVEHDAWHYEEHRQRVLFKIFSWCSRARHVAVSREVATTVRSFSPGTSITVVPPGVDTCRFTPGDRTKACVRLGLDPNWIIIGTVGRLEPVKGHAILLQAMVHLSAEVHVAVVGGGSTLDELHRIAEGLGVETRVHFLGWRDDLERVYPAFDLFCLPSLAEGLPRAALEAQACGISVVASDVGALRDAVCSSSRALVTPGDPRALADALKAELATKDRKSPRDHVSRSFSLEQTKAAYRRLIEGE